MRHWREDVAHRRPADVKTDAQACVDVGRSCVLVSMNGRNIMFDCGMHMGYQDERRFPDFAYISKDRRFTELIDCVIVTHLYVLAAPPDRLMDAALTRRRSFSARLTSCSHLDHCGALPYFTEMCGCVAQAPRTIAGRPIA